jgi:alkylated DNA repair dioxygenase AlkB
VITSFQPSLLTLIDTPPTSADPHHAPNPTHRFGDLHQTERTALSPDAWVDIRRGWLQGGYELFDRLINSSAWRAERRRMYDNVVDVPRLLQFFGDGSSVPWSELLEAKSLLSDHYRTDLDGESFATIGMCLYRDGNDSVAWHGDTLGRGATQDTVVAILVLGSARTFALRPRSGGSSIRLSLGHGDLLAMGGSCQRTWEHAIPKTTHAVGVRVSVQFRVHGVS